jgi:hypothetical protein
MNRITVKVSGINPLLMSNPQTVDRFNVYAKEMARINAKKSKRTDDDYLKLADLEVRSKIYWSATHGIVVPTRWLMATITKNSFKLAKISKADIRGAVFTVESETPLEYKGLERVRTPEDIINNEEFRHKMLLPQGQVRVAKSFPIFHDWSFSTDIEYDPSVIDPDEMERILTHGGKYGGFGDFRPTFGRANVEVVHHD